jgi:hypothetical protein
MYIYIYIKNIYLYIYILACVHGGLGIRLRFGKVFSNGPWPDGGSLVYQTPTMSHLAPTRGRPVPLHDILHGHRHTFVASKGLCGVSIAVQGALLRLLRDMRLDAAYMRWAMGQQGHRQVAHTSHNLHVHTQDTRVHNIYLLITYARTPQLSVIIRPTQVCDQGTHLKS